MGYISARDCVRDILNDIIKNGTYADAALNKAMAKSRYDMRDRAFITQTVYGTLQNLLFLDYQIDSVSKIKTDKMDLDIKNVLRMSVYQIFMLDKIPERAAVNEGVKIIKKYAYYAAGFVNAILRKIIRQGIILPDENDKTEYFSVKYSYPKWMVKRWTDEFGYEQCEKLLKSGNENPPTVIRLNTLKTSKDILQSKMNIREISPKNAFEFLGTGLLADTEEFKEGLFQIQDTASQYAALALGAAVGENVLDMCAAPGGKTACIAQQMQNKGSITAWDIYPNKIKAINNLAKRLGIDIINAYVHDATEPDEKLYKKFDRIIADVPCSGLGVIRKKPDIKWTRTQEDIESLAKTQRQILQMASEYLNDGGTLVYSTCTITHEENQDVVNDFIKKHSDFELCGDMKTFYPHIDGTDGFFVSVLRRRKNG